MRIRTILLPIAVVLCVAALTAFAIRTPPSRSEAALAPGKADDLRATIRQVDAALERLWSEQSAAAGDVPADGALTALGPAPEADDLTVLRRLSLALHGTIPSLQEVRRFQADDRPDRLMLWTNAMLDDSRFSDYFAERLARAYVGIEDGQFLIFRRDRFFAWLSGELRENRPYDEVVRGMIAGQGVWTGSGEVNFLTAGFANDEFDANKLAARTARAFLGQRIDCAQCHDHPFDDWTQQQFEGIAAHYGHLKLTLAGLRDDPEERFAVIEAEGEPPRYPEVALPMHPEWAGQSTGDRERLATWVTSPENDRFGRAISNRVWGLMFGRPFAARVRMHAEDLSTGKSEWIWTDRAVDDLPDPDDVRFGNQLEVLDILARDFRAHDCDLRRLVLVIAGSKAFRLASFHPECDPDSVQHLPRDEADRLRQRIAQIESRWGVFPLVRLRPEQVIGSMLQANHVDTVDRNSHLFVRFQRLFRERDFVNEFGDPGVDELEDRTGTIQQALLRMNGDFANELSKEEAFTATGQISRYSSTPESLLDNLFLATLTRTANQAERDCFLPQLSDAAEGQPDGVIEDIYWALFNAPEFSWNH
ncbi:MAG: DUF1549 domain-containing protein [Planctomycetaceae bacterium]